MKRARYLSNDEFFMILFVKLNCYNWQSLNGLKHSCTNDILLISQASCWNHLFYELFYSTLISFDNRKKNECQWSYWLYI